MVRARDHIVSGAAVTGGVISEGNLLTVNACSKKECFIQSVIKGAFWPAETSLKQR